MLCWYHYFSLFHSYSNYFVIILIVAKYKNVIWYGNHSSNLANCHPHHRGFKFLAKNMRIYSIREQQRAFWGSHCRAGHHSAAVWIGITDVFKPSCTHGRMKVIAQLEVINWLGNYHSLILANLNVICNTKVDMNLNIMNLVRKIRIMNIRCTRKCK